MKIPVSQMRYWDLWPFKGAQIHKLCQWEKRDPRSTVSPVPQYGRHPWEPARSMRPLMSSLDAASRDTFEPLHLLSLTDWLCLTLTSNRMILIQLSLQT